MRRIGTDTELAALAALLAAATLFPVFAAAEQTQIPAAIAAADQTPIVTLHAEGAQLYECKELSGKLAWAFREPIAALMQDGRTVGRHYAGPTWEHTDGSAVVGKAAGSAPAQRLMTSPGSSSMSSTGAAAARSPPQRPCNASTPMAVRCPGRAASAARYAPFPTPPNTCFCAKPAELF